MGPTVFFECRSEDLAVGNSTRLLLTRTEVQPRDSPKDTRTAPLALQRAIVEILEQLYLIGCIWLEPGPWARLSALAPSHSGLRCHIMLSNLRRLLQMGLFFDSNLGHFAPHTGTHAHTCTTRCQSVCWNYV